MRFSNSKYWKRLIVFSILLGTLPVIVLGIFFYQKSSDLIQGKVNDLNMQLLQQNQMRVEEILNNIQSYYMVIAHTYAGRYADMPLDFSQYDTIIDIQKKLVDFQHINSWIRSAYLVNYREDWIIGNDGFGKFSDMINKEEFLRLIAGPRYVFWTFLETPSDTSIHMNVSKEFPMDNVFLLIKLPLNSSNPSEAMIVNLSSTAISQMLSETRDTGKTIILDEKNRILASSDSELIGLSITSLPYLTELEEQKEGAGFFEADSKGERVGISFRKSAYNGWTYLTVYLRSQITSDSRAIGVASVVICLLMVGLIIGVSLLGSTIMYDPIRKVYEIVKKSIKGNGAAHHNDEFAYIGKGINTLLHSQSTMEKQIHSQLLQLEEFFLHQLVNGELGEEECRSKLKALGRKGQWKSMYIVTVQIDSDQGLEENYKRDFLILNIRDLLHDTIPSTFRLQTILKKPGLVMLIGSEETNQNRAKNFIDYYVEVVQQKVYDQLKVKISMGISCSFTQLSNAYLAYRESIEALLCRIQNEQGIVFFDEIRPGKNIADPYPQQLENELVDAINIGCLDHAELVLAEIVEEIFSKNRSVDDLLLCLLRLMISIIKILQDAGERVDCLSDGGVGVLYEELYHLKTSREVKEWFLFGIIKPVMEVLEERRAIQSKVILDQVLQIIHEEFDTDLSLDDCARRLNYHSSYIWRIMRRELNTTFSDYLSQYRLEVAKKWLRDTEITVAEIAERLCYNNSQNFIRFFKKREKLTPGQYREAYRVQK